MTMHIRPESHTSSRGEFQIDHDTATFLRSIQRASAWRLLPYGAWDELGGSRVIFDRQYRPICRVHMEGRVEIVPPETWIAFKRQRWFHRGFGLTPDPETRAIAVEIMQRYGLEAELRRRRELQRRGLLPSPAIRSVRPLAA